MARDQYEENLSRLLADGTEPGLDRERGRRLTISVISAWRARASEAAPARRGFELSPAYSWLANRLKRQPLAYFLPAAAGLVGLLYALGGAAAVRFLIVLGGL